MEETKKKKRKKDLNNQDSKNKERRHIVTWIQEEDVILREQVTLHGTNNWPIIASKFKDKSTRQCRRRWYTYLNSDFKRGGWSPEEDMLLCEAQRVFGNRWTEIAKVVSGRTDNAVKNRFTTLCKKRAKHETMAKEKKRVLFLDDISTPRKAEDEAHIAKRMRRSQVESIMSPFSILARNATGINSLRDQKQMSNVKESDGGGMNKDKENDLLDHHYSPASSEYSSGSTIMVDQSGERVQPLSANTQTEHKQVGEKLLSACNILHNPDEYLFKSGEEKFSSPIKVTPLFRSLAEGIPSPQFSESERNFLLKTLGIESSSPCPSANPSKPPPSISVWKFL